jgi:hypothetical protein
MTREVSGVADKSDPDERDVLVPDPVVRQELGGISEMTLFRYDKDAELKALGFPPKITIRNRNYRSRKHLEAFKTELIRRATRGA